MKGGTLLSVLLMAAACAAVYADHHEHDHREDFNKIDERLDHLTHEVVDLENQIHKRVDKGRINRARTVRALVTSLTGNGCGKRDYQCGGTDPQCVSYLMVCDGVQDCRNGNDEKRCDLPVHKGDVFEGHMIFDYCTKRQPDTMTMRITDVYRAEYFKPIAKVNVDVGIDVTNRGVHIHAELPTIGWYNVGLRRLILMPPEADRLGLVCQFDDGSRERCIADIKHEASLETCAKLVFVRQH
jgi:hypothetical protein